MAKTTGDKLAVSLRDALNDGSKSGDIAYLLGDGKSPTDITEWVSTGSTMLDLDISNRPNGGLPVGRISELLGMESSGKSLIATHVLANTQKMGGVAVYIDTEIAVSKDFLETIGVDVSKLVYTSPETIEEAFEVIESIIENVRKSDNDRLITIVMDSVAGIATRSEVEGDYDKAGYNTDKAIVIGQALRKITKVIADQRILLLFTNQFRNSMLMGYGETYIQPGGKALPYHASVIVKLQRVKYHKKTVNGIEYKTGIQVKSLVTKNRCGPPMRTSLIDIFFDRGIDDYNTWMDILKKHKYATGKASVTMPDENGELIKLTNKKFVAKLKSEETFRDYIYNIICNFKIMEYQKNESSDDSEK